MTINTKVVTIFLAVFTGLIIGIIFLAVALQNAPNRTELNELKKENKAYTQQINELSMDQKQAWTLANQTEEKYVADTIKLSALQYSFDSLANQLKKSKYLTHAKVTSIGHLSDSASVILFRANLHRLSSDIGN